MTAGWHGSAVFVGCLALALAGTPPSDAKGSALAPAGGQVAAERGRTQAGGLVGSTGQGSRGRRLQEPDEGADFPGEEAAAVAQEGEPAPDGSEEPLPDGTDADPEPPEVKPEGMGEEVLFRSRPPGADKQLQDALAEQAAASSWTAPGGPQETQTFVERAEEAVQGAEDQQAAVGAEAADLSSRPDESAGVMYFLLIDAVMLGLSVLSLKSQMRAQRRATMHMLGDEENQLRPQQRPQEDEGRPPSQRNSPGRAAAHSMESVAPEKMGRSLDAPAAAVSRKGGSNGYFLELTAMGSSAAGSSGAAMEKCR